MRVVYDISPLGASQDAHFTRTGIYRVVERLAYGLAASPECRLILSGFNCPEESSAYWHASEGLRGVQFLVPDFPTVWPKLLDYRDVRLIRAPAPPRWHLPKRALRRLARWSERHFPSPAPPTELALPSRTDIFHSPFCPLPEWTKEPARAQRFLTVYDLTPILFPHFFANQEDRMQKEMLGSLEPEDWVLCISESCREDLCDYLKIDPSRVFVTPLAADRELFYPCPDAGRRAAVRKRYGIPDAPYLLSLCTLQPRKNLAHLIRAFGTLVRQEGLDDLRLVLVGAKGWSEGPIFEEISRLGPLRERVIATGYVADEDLAPLYSGALAFVYPSFYEGFGLPPLEAMQCGVPVITSNTSSLPEVVGQAGRMLDPTDADGLCQSLLELYQDRSLREEMARKSVAQAGQFSWERCVKQTLRAYKTALKRASRRRVYRAMAALNPVRRPASAP